MAYIIVDNDNVNTFTSNNKTAKNATKPFFAKQLEKSKVTKRK